MFEIKDLSPSELIRKWNEYCWVHNYNEDEIYQMVSITDFAQQWYAAESNMILADCVEDLLQQVKDYNGERYYYWCNGNACWFDDLLGKGSPIACEPLQEWLNMEEE